MADDYSWIGPLISGVGSAVNSYATADEASGVSQAAFAEMLRNLRERFGDFDALGDAGYEQFVPAQLGPSGLAGIAEDPDLKMAQGQSLAALQELIDSGGLTLADLKALNDVQRNLNANDTARRKGIANEYAARGQLGAGAQLGMDLANAQDAASNAARAGESAAASAQDRAFKATMGRGELAGRYSDADYRRKAEAARAGDAINQWNASARNDGAKYRNTVKGQAFEDQLSKARGKTAVTGSLNDTLYGSAKDKAGHIETQGKLRNDMFKAGGNAASSFGGTSSSDSVAQHESGSHEDDDEREH